MAIITFSIKNKSISRVVQIQTILSTRFAENSTNNTYDTKIFHPFLFTCHISFVPSQTLLHLTIHLKCLYSFIAYIIIHYENISRSESKT